MQLSKHRTLILIFS